MRKKAYVFFATGFEETEAIGTTDVLRRGNVETVERLRVGMASLS